MSTVYECENPACSLGVVGSPGRFTGGITPQQAEMLTGDPEAETGEGICPNCGKPATETDETHESAEGTDPYQEFHDQVKQEIDDLRAAALDPDDSTSQEDVDHAMNTAQAKVAELAEGKGE